MTAIEVHSRQLEALVVANGCSHQRAARIAVGDAGSPLQRVHARGQKQHPLELQAPRGFLRRDQVPVVWRVERAAQQSEADQLTDVPP
jgi:hypothetical protein